MSKYLNDIQKDKIRNAQAIVYSLRKEIIADCGVDIMDTDSLSSISVFDIVSQYDPLYDVNFARNGEDGKSGIIEDIETKVTKMDGYMLDGNFVQCKYKPDKGEFTKPRNIKQAIEKRDASFQFHVMGDIKHDAYIFAVSIKDSLSFKRLYDIRSPHNVDLINNRLIYLKDEYLKRSGGAVKKNDVVYVSEEYMLNNITDISRCIINECDVLRA